MQFGVILPSMRMHSIEKPGLEGNEKRGDTLKCLFRGEAADRAECPLFFFSLSSVGRRPMGTSPYIT